jgi:hypothetical protein
VLRPKTPKVQGTGEFTAGLLQEWRELVHWFESNAPVGKCGNCGHKADRYRKDGPSRLYIASATKGSTLSETTGSGEMFLVPMKASGEKCNLSERTGSGEMFLVPMKARGEKFGNCEKY